MTVEILLRSMQINKLWEVNSEIKQLRRNLENEIKKIEQIDPVSII